MFFADTATSPRFSDFSVSTSQVVDAEDSLALPICSPQSPSAQSLSAVALFASPAIPAKQRQPQHPDPPEESEFLNLLFPDIVDLENDLHPHLPQTRGWCQQGEAAKSAAPAAASGLSDSPLGKSLYPTPFEAPLDAFSNTSSFSSLPAAATSSNFASEMESFVTGSLNALLPSPCLTPNAPSKTSPPSVVELTPFVESWDCFDGFDVGSDFPLFDGPDESPKIGISFNSSDSSDSNEFNLFDHSVSIPDLSSTPACETANFSPVVKIGTPVVTSQVPMDNAVVTMSLSELTALLSAARAGTNANALFSPRATTTTPDRSDSVLDRREKQKGRRRVSKLHQCSFPGCEKMFTRAFNLKTHELIHDSCRDRPFVCELCDKNFVRIHDLNRHMVIHNPIKGFTCGKCGKGFARNDALTRHLTNASKCRGN
ncbi:hypothetical protein DFJ73DRAFT_806911 [Zopfochytrium polystomum]|nr:hypothetical protein DFJ73DRAFT_806911 [Zopfochytrium polystomum]